MQIKKAILYTAGIMLALAVGGCTDDEIFSDDSQLSLEAHDFGLSQSSYDLSSLAQSATEDVYASLTWAFSNSAQWVTVSPASGSGNSTVTLNVSENMSGSDSRTNVMYLTSTATGFDASLPVSISQAAATPYAIPNVESLSFTGQGGTAEVSVSTNIIPTASTAYSWITATVSTDGKSVQITATPNTTSRSRSGMVTLLFDGNSLYTIYVTQAMATMNIDGNTTITCENTATTFRVKVQSELSWTPSTSDSWIDFTSGTRTSNDSILDISISPNTLVNSRTGYVTITMANGQSVVITIVQRGIYVILSGDLKLISTMGETREITVESNTSWTSISPDSWITVSPVIGEGNGTLTVTIADNPSLSARNGRVIVQSVANNTSDTIYVTQYGKTFSVDSTAVSFTDKGGTQAVGISANHTWTATVRDGAEWLSVSPLTGEGSGQLEITATENNTTEDRTGYVDIIMYDKTYSIAVHQYSKYFLVSSPVIDFTSGGGSSSVEISSNDTWNVNVEAGNTWLTAEDTNGTGNATFSVTAADNPSAEPRQAYVDFESQNAGTIRITYNQAARYLTSNRSDFTFFAKGGTSELTTISTDGKYKIEQEGGWFFINKIDENSFTVTVTENSAHEGREGFITISLTDLTSGELKVVLPVRQLSEGATFTRGDFSEEVNWNTGTSATGVMVTVIGFTGDRSWNVNSGTKGAITFSGYTEDSNWGPHYNSKGNIIGYGFGNDDSWNQYSGNKFNGNVNGYGSDSDWNDGGPRNGFNVRIIGKGYGKDADWNKKNGLSTNVGKTGYVNDNDWNNK